MNLNKNNYVVSLYIPENLIREHYPYSALMFPFWGIQERKNSPFMKETFKYNFDTRYYSITKDPSVADYVFMPYNYWFLLRQNNKLIARYVKEAFNLKKPLLIDAIGDRDSKININNSVVLRYATYKNKIKNNDIIIPVYCEDLLESYKDGNFTAREKKETLIIGFSGWSDFSFFTLPRSYVKNIHLLILGVFTSRFNFFLKGIFLRKKVIKILKKSKLINTNFIERKSFSGNLKTALGDIKTLRKEFVENILESDYSLCVRGDANQSTRFFEVLALGRIPIFIDTKIPLPLEDKINYREFCVFVNYRDIKNIDKIIADFHSKISPEEFRQMQEKAREAYEKYLRLDSYTKYLMKILKEKVKKEDCLKN